MIPTRLLREDREETDPRGRRGMSEGGRKGKGHVGRENRKEVTGDGRPQGRRGWWGRGGAMRNS